MPPLFRQMLRGCRYLPHVGSHPGTLSLITMLILAPLIGTSLGPTGAMIGFAVTFLSLVPLYLRSAVCRAKISDHYQHRPAAGSRTRTSTLNITARKRATGITPASTDRLPRRE